MSGPVFKTTEEAFAEAIAAGILSPDPAADNYADLYMYMGHWSGVGRFKHRNTRKYIPPISPTLPAE